MICPSVPAAAAVALFLLAFPWLRRAMGLQTVEPERFPVRLETDFPKASPTRRWIPGVLKLSPDGAWLCSAGPGGNGMLRPFFGADLLGEIPAGSGALALEALSRGADFAALADRDREAVSCIRRNGEKLRFMDAMRIYAGDWRQALSQMKGEERRFDLVFLDPPYRMPVLEECCAALADLGLLEADALLVLEHRLDAVPSPDGRFALWKDRAYGDTAIHFFHYRESV